MASLSAESDVHTHNTHPTMMLLTSFGTADTIKIEMFVVVMSGIVVVPRRLGYTAGDQRDEKPPGTVVAGSPPKIRHKWLSGCLARVIALLLCCVWVVCAVGGIGLVCVYIRCCQTP